MGVEIKLLCIWEKYQSRFLAQYPGKQHLIHLLMFPPEGKGQDTHGELDNFENWGLVSYPLVNMVSKIPDHYIWKAAIVKV